MARPRKTAVLEEYRLQSIREAAARVVAREGVVGATMQAIADEAGVAKGTIYLYFKDRDALFASVNEALFTELLSRIEVLLEKRQTFAETLRELVETDLRFFEENGEMLRFYHQIVERERSSRKHRECHPVHQQYLEALTAFIEGGMKRRELRRQDPERLAAFISEGMISILLRRLLEPASPPISDDIELLVGTILHGVERRTS